MSEGRHDADAASDELRRCLAHWSNHSAWSSAMSKRNLVPTAYLPVNEAFAVYLGSDDTRLPAHASLDSTREAPSGDDAADVAPRPCFDEEVEAVSRHILALQDPQSRHTDADFGVVVGGGYGLFDDASWATLNGSARCVDARDVFSVLKCSTRVRTDLDWQRHAASLTTPFVRLSRFIEHHPGHCYRIFVEGGRVIAISQRSVDQIHGHLTSMSETEHRTLFDTLKAPLEGRLIPTIRRRSLEVLGEESAAAPDVKSWIDRPTLVCDVVFEGGSLPVFVLGCRALRSLDDLSDWQRALARERELALTVHHDPEGVRRDSAVFQWAPADALAFRLLRTVEGLRCFAFGDDGERNGPPRREVAIARDVADLCGDGKQMASNFGLPLELQHPEWFAGDPQLKEMLLRIQQEQAQQQQ